MAANRKISPKAARFVDAYIVSLNATSAAKEAGYSAKTAKSQGQRLLTNVDIAAAIAAAKAERSGRMMITAERVLTELARLAFIDIGQIFNDDGSMKPLSEMEEDARRAIVGLEVSEIRDNDGVVIGYIKKIKLADKLSALEKLGKHLGLFDQRLTVDAKGDGLSLLIQAVQGSSFKPIVIDGEKAA
jgi:phage terminase small subunit